jgi:hypothetical protein
MPAEETGDPLYADPAQLLQGREVEQGWAADRGNAVRREQPRQSSARL